MGWTLREIADAFEGEGFTRGRVPENLVGARRSLVEQYYDTIDWSSPKDVKSVLYIYQDVLRLVTETDYREGLVKALRRDRCEVLQSGEIVPGAAHVLSTIPLSSLTDPAVILEHFDRIRLGSLDDPAQVIGASKELVESTCKLVLQELGVPFGRKDEMSDLAKKAQQALGVHTDVLGGDARSAGGVMRTLGSLSGIVGGLAEMRNSGGTGHGRERVTAFNKRHAHLALGGAAAYCQFLLATLEDPAAPWKKVTR